MNILYLFTSYKQRNQKEETKAAYRGDGKMIFRGRNGYDVSIYSQACTRTGVGSSFMVLHVPFLFFIVLYFTV